MEQNEHIAMVRRKFQTGNFSNLNQVKLLRRDLVPRLLRHIC